MFAQKSNTRSKSRTKQNILYEEGQVLAFVDPTADDPEHFKLCLLKNQVLEEQEDFKADIFLSEGKNDLQFTKSASSKIVLENTVVKAVSKPAMNSEKTKGKTKVNATIKIAKSEFNQIKKAVPKILKELEENEESGEDEQSEEEEEEEKQPARKVVNVRALKPKKALTQPNKADTEMSDNKQKKSLRDKLTANLGSKRGRQEMAANQLGIEVEQEEKSPSAEKKRKASKSKIVPKSQPVKKAAKVKVEKPKLFKLGKWNPDIEIVQFEPEKFGKENKLIDQGSARINSRQMHRAAWTGNFKLMKDLLFDTKNVSLPLAHWGPDDHTNPLQALFKAGHGGADSKFLELLLTPPVKEGQNQTQFQAMNDLFQRQGQFQMPQEDYLLSKIDTGKVSNMAYGAQIRQVQMTRGGRQGNQAFLEYRDDRNSCWNMVQHHFCQFKQPQYNPMYISDEDFSDAQMETLLKLMSKHNPQSQLYGGPVMCVYQGFVNAAAFITKQQLSQSNFGLNELHHLALCNLTKKQLEDIPKNFRAVSVTKKSNTNQNATPMHFACVNPNNDVLQTFIKLNSDIHCEDSMKRKPIHYAALCKNPKNLETLIEKGANVFDVANLKLSPILLAAMLGRHENIRVILKHAPEVWKQRDSAGYNAMAYACRIGCQRSIEALLEAGNKINTGCGPKRMPPMHWAALYGRFELVQWLIDNKGKVNSKDKFKRSPLTMAVRNGHLKVASLLLQNGADVDQADSSGNTPLHHAAAYGWSGCVELLVKAKAKLNALNSWKTSPINIAMLKNNEFIVKQFLAYDEVDVNCLDEQGRNLLQLSVFAHLTERSYDFVKFLLDKKADPNMPDVDGRTTMHALANFNLYQPKHPNWHHVHDPEMQERADKMKVFQLKIADLLIQRNTSITAVDKDEKTPFALCLERDNVDLLKKLLAGVSLQKNPEILHHLTPKILDVRYQAIMEDLLKQEQQTNESMNNLDSIGMTPFLAYIDHFCNNFNSIHGDLVKLINHESVKHGTDFTKYEITNKDLFDQDKIDPTKKQRVFSSFRNNQQPVAQSSMSEADKVKHADTLIDDLLVKPFVNTIKILIQFGADPKAKVAKLKKFRDLDMKVRQTEEVKKREEVMVERQKADGKKQEEQYDKRGLQTCMHFLVKAPHPLLIDLLIKKVHLNETDSNGKTALHVLGESDGFKTNFNPFFDRYFESMIKNGAQISILDKQNRSAALNFYHQNQIGYANQLLKMGSDINQMDKSGLTIIKYALIRRDADEIQRLVDQGAQINQLDYKGRNLLHHAVNMSSASADASFEIEQLLIDLGIDFNKLDIRNRTPLHYAFVKIKDHNLNNQCDPIETVSSMCGIKGIVIDQPDLWGKTPLHYASQRGASICAMYLERRGANLESKDTYGNTPLGIGLLNDHHNFGIIMIQKNANVNAMVYKVEEKRQEQPDKVKKQEKEPKHRNMFEQKNFYDDEDDESEEMSDEEGEDEMEANAFNQNPYGVKMAYAKKAVHRGGFNQGRQPLIFGNVAFGNPSKEAQIEEEAKKEEEPEAVSLFRLAVKKGQLGLAYLMLDQGYNLSSAIQDSMDEKKFQLVQTLMSKNPDDSIIQKRNDKDQSLLHILAMNSNFCSVIHLKKIYDQLIKRGVQFSKDTYGRYPLHYAVKAQCFTMVEMLLKHNEDVNTFDNEGNTPLSLLVDGDNLKTLRIFNSKTNQFNPIFEALIRAEEQAIKNVVDQIWTKYDTNHSGSLDKAQTKKFLNDNGADFSEHVFKRFDVLGNGVIEKDEMMMFIKQTSQFYKLRVYQTISCKQVKLQDDQEIICDGLLGLLKVGNIFKQDEFGKDALSYAIHQNKTDVVKFLLTHCEKAHMDKDLQDKHGKTHAHLVVNPLEYGSFENEQILQDLYDAGYDLNQKDSQGKTPLDYAKLQASGLMQETLLKLSGKKSKAKRKSQATISYEGATENQFKNKIDFEKDAEDFLKQAQEKEKKEVDLKAMIPVDKTGNFERSYQVYIEGDKPWDVYMTKVDLKNGIYGDYVFYKMQLLHDSIRDLYVVFTRYGRIGEDGMNQRTPFGNIDEAKKEFNSIFKSKSGNEFLQPFVAQKKKYEIARVKYDTVKHKEYLAPFDYKKAPQSALEKNKRNLLEEITNFTMYQKAMGDFGIDQEVLPFAKIEKQSLTEAMEVLKQLSITFDEEKEIQKAGIKADFDKVMEVKSKILDLSSKFYQIIPLSQYKDAIAPPITNAMQIREHFNNIEQLLNIEYASKMLLGALKMQYKVNPVDYIHNCLQIRMEYLSPDLDETKLLMQYIKQTSEHCFDQKTHKVNLFKVERRGELERMKSADLHNHKLLFHGSSITNYLGILSQGMRIAPPEAPTTGYMFGKGVYFADTFAKSFAYTGSYQFGISEAKQSSLLLLCDVALGNIKKKWQAEYVESLPLNVHSVQGVGKMGPSKEGNVTTQDGIVVPAGNIIDQKDVDPNPPQIEEPQQQNLFGGFRFNQNIAPVVNLQHNEYIVYNVDQIRVRYLVQVVQKTKEELKLK